MSAFAASLLKTPPASSPRSQVATERSAAPVFCVSVQAEGDPGMLGRLLGTLAKRGLLPSRLHSVLIDEIGAFQVDLQVEGVDADSGERIAASLRQIVGVEWVLTAFKNR